MANFTTARLPLSSATPSATPERAAGQSRIVALDFTKGFLVLLMVLYHWLNYFISTEGSFYKYLRFLTPSFIFVTGFLVSHVYLRKYDIFDSRLPFRLFERGWKLVAIFAGLNLLIATAGSQPGIAWREWMLFLVGSSSGRRAAFSVLLPIGYVLLCSAGLVFLTRWDRKAPHFVAAALLASIPLLGIVGIANSFLELITIGFLGVSLGHFSLDWTRKLAASPWPLLIAYGGYLTAITLWNEIFALQVVGVCLTLTLIFLVGGQVRGPGGLGAPVVLLGRYSLYAYIVHIMILQVLRAMARQMDAATLTTALALPCAALLTLLSVATLERARARLPFVNRLYGAVFA